MKEVTIKQGQLCLDAFGAFGSLWSLLLRPEKRSVLNKYCVCGGGGDIQSSGNSCLSYKINVLVISFSSCYFCWFRVNITHFCDKWLKEGREEDLVSAANDILSLSLVLELTTLPNRSNCTRGRTSWSTLYLPKHPTTTQQHLTKLKLEKCCSTIMPSAKATFVLLLLLLFLL